MKESGAHRLVPGCSARMEAVALSYYRWCQGKCDELLTKFLFLL